MSARYRGRSRSASGCGASFSNNVVIGGAGVDIILTAALVV